MKDNEEEEEKKSLNDLQRNKERKRIFNATQQVTHTSCTTFEEKREK